MLEKIVLIFALFGSAKVALDMIAAAFTKKDAASSGHKVKEVQTNEELNRIVILLEEMSKKNEALQLRLAAVEAEHSAASTQQKTAKRVTKKSTPIAPAAEEGVSKSIVDSILQGPHSDAVGATPYYVDAQRFEVVMG